ncbi:cysteine--tRNA ligase, partial [bacterium]|nr:cysteine--tRNA ligase [bacterium]
SKSTGNLVTIEEFLSKYRADTLRFTVLNSGYRSPLTFTDEVLGQSEKALERLSSGFRPSLPGAKGASESALKSLQEQVKITNDNFISSMDDDFNSAGALGGLFDLVRVINQTRTSGATETELREAQSTLRHLSDVLGLELAETAQSESNADNFVTLLVELRTKLRQDKQWAYGDLIRDRLKELGVTLEDSKDGTQWRWG